MSETKLLLILLATLTTAGCPSVQPTPTATCQATPPTWTVGATVAEGIVQLPEEEFKQLVVYVLELESCAKTFRF